MANKEMNKKSALRKGGLGKGLNALISVHEDEEETVEVKKQPEVAGDSAAPMMVNIYSVEPDHEQPRRVFDEGSLEELANSIKQYGVLQPILVNQCGDYYKIIAGERRWRAAKKAGITEVPIVIKETSGEKSFEISLIENIQRQDLNPIEEALAYKRLMDEYALKQDEISQKVGKSRSAIANFLRLLNLDPEVQNLIQDGVISQGHAKVLLGIQNMELQYELALKVIDEDLSVRQLERYVHQIQNEKPKKEEVVDDSIYRSVEEHIQDLLHTKVNIIRGKRKGKIEIEYYSDEDLERLVMMFGSMRNE